MHFLVTFPQFKTLPPEVQIPSPLSSLFSTIYHTFVIIAFLGMIPSRASFISEISKCLHMYHLHPIWSLQHLLKWAVWKLLFPGDGGRNRVRARSRTPGTPALSSECQHSHRCGLTKFSYPPIMSPLQSWRCSGKCPGRNLEEEIMCRFP